MYMSQSWNPGLRMLLRPTGGEGYWSKPGTIQCTESFETTWQGSPVFHQLGPEQRVPSETPVNQALSTAQVASGALGLPSCGRSLPIPSPSTSKPSSTFSTVPLWNWVMPETAQWFTTFPTTFMAPSVCHTAGVQM